MMDQYPSFWRTVELRQIASFVSGGTPSRKEEKYFTGTIPWLTGYDLPEDKVVNVFEGREQITDDAIRASATSPVEAGTVLLTTRVTVGKVAIARTKLCFSQDITGISIADTNVITPEFLAYYLLSTRELLLRRNRGSTIQGVIRRDVERLQIPIPTLSEQKQIIEVLRQAEEVRQIRQQSDERIQSLLHSIFYDFFEKEKPITSKWTTRLIKEISSLVTSGSTPRGGESVYVSDGTYFIRSQNVLMNKLDLSNVACISEEIRQSMDRTKVNEGDVLLNITGASIGRVAWVEKLPREANVSQHVCIIRPIQDKVLPEYLSVYISLPRMQDYILLTQAGASRQALNHQQVRKLKIPVPPIELQREFIELVYQSREIESKRAETAFQLVQLINSLLSRAFTGELTRTWREANIAILHEEATKRDSGLGAQSKTPLVADFESKQSAHEIYVEESALFDERHPRYEILKSLSDVQRKVYFAIQQHVTYFTVQSLSDEGGFPLETVRRTLPLLETLGLTRQVSVAISPNTTDVYFIDAYRNLAAKDDSRSSDLEILQKLASDSSKTTPTL